MTQPANRSITSWFTQSISFSLRLLTCRVGEVEDAGGRLQQVGAAGRQVSGDGHDGHAVATLLGAHDAVVLRLNHAAIAAEQSRAVGISGSLEIKQLNEDTLAEIMSYICQYRENLQHFPY